MPQSVKNVLIDFAVVVVVVVFCLVFEGHMGT